MGNIETNINTKFLEDFIEPMAIEECRDLGNKIFAASLAACPTATGALKNSGSMVATAKGCEITYTAAYAEQVDKTPQSQLQSGQTHFFTNSILNNKGSAKYEHN